MRHLFGALALALCFSAGANAAPTTYTFDLDDGSLPITDHGFFTVNGPVGSSGKQVFSVLDGSLLALSFSIPVWGPDDVYDLDGAHSPWPNAALSKPLVPSSVEFTDGTLSAIHYEIKVSGTPGEGHMMDEFIVIHGLEVTAGHAGVFQVTDVTPVPEPGSLLLCCAGLAALIYVHRRSKAGAPQQRSAVPA